ncbi:hypothetical protein ACBQ28_22535 [Pseudomonas lundensis]|uniref:hypothetical protein n=1 Tax=Pseudomonas lundensis TaxID=86185 RepID=UPI0035255408
MNERYITKKVITANVQGKNNGHVTGPDSTHHWEVQEKSTGNTVGGPYAGLAEAEDTCLKLNYPRS